MQSPIIRSVILVASLAAVGFLAGCSAKARSERHLRQADAYFAAGKYPEAEVEYLNVLKSDRMNPRAIAKLGVLYFDQGRVVKAYPYVMKGVELSPNDDALRFRAGLIYLNEGKVKEARAAADAILDRSPTNSDAPLLLAQSVRTPEDTQAAHERLTKLLQQTGGTPSLYVGLGTVLIVEGDRSAAQEAIRHALERNPNSSAAHYALGMIYQMNNDVTNAETELKLAADNAPARSTWRMDYVEFKLRRGQVEDARRILLDSTKTVPDYVPAWIKLAQIALAQKKLDDCESFLTQVLSRDPNNYEAVSLSGGLKLAKGQTDQAIADLERLNAIYDRSAQARYNLALAYSTKGDTAKAIKAINDAVQLNPNLDDAVLMQAQLNIQRDNANLAVTSLTTLIQRRPQLAQAYLLLAAAYTSKGNWDDALATYQKLSVVYPQNPQVRVLIGSVLQVQGEKAEAQQSYEKALELAPGFLPAVEQLVRLNIVNKQPDAALKLVQSELEKNTNSAPLQAMLAQALNAKSDTAGAEQALKKAIALDPKLQTAYMMLAQLYFESKQNDKAVAQLNQIVADHPGDTAALMLLAVIQNEQKNYSAARDTYEKLLAINPAFSPALNNLAYLYCEQFNQLDKAFDAARRARDLLPYDPYTADTLGWVLFRRGDYSWALNLLQESAQKLPQEPEIQFHVGMTYYMLGDEARARTALAHAAAADKEFPTKAEAARRVATLDIDPRTAGADALSSLESRLRERPDDPVALNRVTAIYLRDNAPEKAAAAYTAAVNQDPRNPRLLLQSALLYSGPLHDIQKALEFARNANKLAPDDADIAATLGRLSFETGDYKSALSLLQQSAQKKSSDPELAYLLAKAYYSQGNVDDAESSARNALALNATFDSATDAKQFVDLIGAARDSAKAAEAQPRAQQALQSNPTNVPALMVMAGAAEHGGDTAAAAQFCEKALAKYPDFVPAMKRLALHYADKGDNDARAYELATKAHAVLPGDNDLDRTLGILSYRRGDYKAAVRFLTPVSQLDNPDGPALYYLGMAQYRLKQTRESKSALQRALTLNVPAELAQEAKRVLDELK